LNSSIQQTRNFYSEKKIPLSNFKLLLPRLEILYEIQEKSQFEYTHSASCITVSHLVGSSQFQFNSTQLSKRPHLIKLMRKIVINFDEWKCLDEEKENDEEERLRVKTTFFPSNSTNSCSRIEMTKKLGFEIQ